MMPSIIPADFDDAIANAYFAWFTTVRADGLPQPTPVWFIREGDTLMLYTASGAHKLKNIDANPQVALNFALDVEGEQFIVIMGEARVDTSIPMPIDNVPYLAKYRDGIDMIGMTPESFNETFNIPLRITPTQVRGQLE